MSTITSWRPLSLSPSTSSPLPPLLISTSFTPTTYTVALTDLTHLWRESLPRRAILKRSLDEDTSIDPSEDSEQLRLFLSKLASSLSGASGTSLALRARPSSSSSSNVGADVSALELSVTAQLPKGMRVLEWRFELEVRPQVELTTCLTVPLVMAVRAGVREARGLVEVVGEKDHVIRKLVEKLENVGVEIAEVFPAAGMGKLGRKAVSRKVLEERVRGLGVFEVEGWRKGLREREDKERGEKGRKKEEGVRGVVGEVFGELDEVVMDPVSNLDEDGHGNWRDWWELVKDNPVELFNKIDGHDTKDETAIDGDAPKNGEPSSEQEDDFQIQETPASNNSDHVSSPPTVTSHAIIQDSTDDEDDDDGEDFDAPSQRSLVPDSVPVLPLHQGPRKLGAIGRSKPAPAPAPAPKASYTTLTAAPESNPNGKLPAMADDDEGDETASEDNEDDYPLVISASPPTSSPKVVSPEPAPAPVKAKKASSTGGGLGRIGGKAKAAPAPAVESNPPPAPAPAPEHKQKHKLGIIGHKTSSTTAPTTVSASAAVEEVLQTEDGKIGKGDEQGEKDRGKRETSIERADRKREELKRVLEEKARAPGKKRRKF